MLKWYECAFPVQWVQPPKRSLLQTRRCPKIKRKSWRRKRNDNRNSSRNRCNSWRNSIWSRIHARWAGGGSRQLRFNFAHHGREKIPAVLTLNMLNCFEDCKRFHHISYHVLDFVQQKKTKLTMQQPYMLHILYCQCHACWCPGDLMSQCISRHVINQIILNAPISSIRRVENKFSFHLMTYIVFLSFTYYVH